MKLHKPAVSPILLTVSLFSLLSCREGEKPTVPEISNSIKLSQEEVGRMLDVISNSYFSEDAKLFTDWENCYYKNHLTDTTFLTSRYFDTIEEGLSFKYFYCPYNNLYYNVLRSRNGDLHYKGLSELPYLDKYFEDKYFEENYKEVNGIYLSPTGALSLLDFNAEALTEILNYDSVFDIHQKGLTYEQEKGIVFDLIESLIIHSYQLKVSNRTIKPLFEKIIPIEQLEDELRQMKGANSVLSEAEVNNILTPYLKLREDSFSKLLIGKVNNYGLFLFHVRKHNGRFIINQKLIPVLKRLPENYSDLVYRGTYPNCDSLLRK
ncbi:MAG: hypothetical protein ACO1OQ_14270 [Rufibacter sp.]